MGQVEATPKLLDKDKWLHKQNKKKIASTPIQDKPENKNSKYMKKKNIRKDSWQNQ